MTCYFLLFWFILTLHDRTGRLEKQHTFTGLAKFLHDRTGRLESHELSGRFMIFLHDRTGRLETSNRKNSLLIKLHDRTGRLENIAKTVPSVSYFTTAQVA